MDKRRLAGIITLSLIALLLYLGKKSEKEIAIELKPLTVHLELSEQVKKRLEQTGARLAVQTIVSDHGIKSSPLDATILEHREQVLAPGSDRVHFDGTRLNIEIPKAGYQIDPSLSIRVVSHLSQPAGNCIQCDAFESMLSTLPAPETAIEVRCDRWLEIGVCVSSEVKH